MKTYHLIVEERTKYQIELLAIRCGEDFSVILCGGSLYHVGATALGYISQGSVIVNSQCAPHHRDDVVARWACEFLTAELNCNICVSVGIHIDDAKKEEILHLVENCKAACRQFVLECKESDS